MGEGMVHAGCSLAARVSTVLLKMISDRRVCNDDHGISDIAGWFSLDTHRFCVRAEKLAVGGDLKSPGSASV